MAANEASVDVHDHGIALDEKKRKVQCNYCGKVVGGFSRLKCHLGGVGTDVASCEKASAIVKELMRNMLLEKKRESLIKEVGELYHPNLPWKRNFFHQTNGNSEISQTTGSESKRPVKMESLSDNSGAESIPFSIGRMGSQEEVESIEEDPSFCQAEKYIGRFFFETGIDFSAAKSPSFRKMINATLGCGKTGFKIPGCHELKGRILEEEVRETKQYVNEIRNSWANTGCSILLDGWIDKKGRNLITILVDCPKGVTYLRSSDISAIAEDVDAMRGFFDEVLEEVGVSNVVQIMTYSTSPCMEAVGKYLVDKHRTLFWTVSATHCIEMMLEKIAMMDPVKEVIEKAKTITQFIHSSASVLKLLKNHTCGRDLVKPSNIRSAVPFLTLENIVLEKERLKNMFISPEWNSSIWASTREGKWVADLVAGRSFWNGTIMVLKAAFPLVRVLDLISERDKHQLCYIYETIDQAKETIKMEFKGKKSQYIAFWEVIDEIWNNHLHSHLHSAGYFLNPRLFYSTDFFADAEVANGLLCCIVRMAEDRRVQDLITLQVEEYRRARGAFGTGSDINQRSNIPPALWWSNYGGECPELQRLTIRILSQTCDGASKYALKRTTAERLLTEGRNYVEQQRLNDLAFVHYTLQLRNFEPIGVSNNILFDEIDPMNDWMVGNSASEDLSQNCEPIRMDLGYRDSTAREGPSTIYPKEEPS